MKYRIKEVTLRNGYKIYTPQWSRLGILWSGFSYSFSYIRRAWILKNEVFIIQTYSIEEANAIFTKYEEQEEKEKLREKISIKYLDR